MRTSMIKCGIGQDSHRFLLEKGGKVCIIGGVPFDEVPGWDADSDGDIVYHAICNAISSVTHVPILGGVAIRMCREEGITDSKEYLLRAKETLKGWKISHISLSIELKRPKLQPSINKMRHNIAALLDVHIDEVGITCTSGNGMNDFGKGIGGGCMCIITLHKGS